ncbi:hypothetical protein [Nocardia cyriacigeorgica]|uniref:hypothetical protein n=1 Tax=Nocardia cyriacigeorgica TaxID=135487 RepID=UPI0034DB3AB2
MPRYVHVPTEATTHLIRQAYEAGGPYQWAREAWKNSEESGASIIHFGIEEQAAELGGVLRRTIMDNGSGMKPDDLRTFLTTFGGGGKPIGVDGNFGQGFKSSVLPWNPYGVVVISYTEDAPDGAMLWIHRDPNGNYVLKEWEIADEHGEFGGLQDVVVPFWDQDHNCDWSAIRPSWMNTGTVMVLLGDGPDCDTWAGDAARQETVGGLVRYLNGRLLDVPEVGGEPLQTTVIDQYEKSQDNSRRDTKDKTINLSDGRAIVLKPRRIYGMKHFIPAQAKSGTVRVDSHGTTIDWYYVPEPEKPVGATIDYIFQKPTVSVDYQGEAYHSDHAKHRYRQFGITDEIQGRTWLIIKPPVYSDSRPTAWGVLTQASRHMLIAKGGLELPWEEWGDAFYNQFPDELAAARDAARANAAKSDPNLSKNLSRILDRLNPRFKASRILSSTMGHVVGNLAEQRVRTPGGSGRVSRGEPAGGGSKSKSRQIVTPASDGASRGVNANTKGGYPAPLWKNFTAEEAKYLAIYQENDGIPVDGTMSRGVVYLNSSHPVFAQEFYYWTNQIWPKSDPKQVQDLVKRIYGEEAIAHVVHAQRLNGTVVGRDESGKPLVMGRADVEELLTPDSLTSALLGLVNVEQRVLTQGGGLFGSKSGS